MVHNSVKHLAELYAVWWGREQELYQYGFLAKYGQGMYNKNWAKRLIKNCTLIYEHPDNQKILQTFTLSRQHLLQQLLKSRSEAQSYLDKLPHTLLHQDLWLSNIGRWGGKTVLIDWTNMGVGPPGIDVCQLCFYLMQTDLKFDPQSLIEKLCLALKEDWGIAISYDQLLKSYELAFCLRPVSILGACILRDILNGNATMTGVAELEQKLNASESIFQWIERGARCLAGQK
jgi:thiamine kinase-like enzyme